MKSEGRVQETLRFKESGESDESGEFEEFALLGTSQSSGTLDQLGRRLCFKRLRLQFHALDYSFCPGFLLGFFKV